MYKCHENAWTYVWNFIWEFLWRCINECMMKMYVGNVYFSFFFFLLNDDTRMHITLFFHFFDFSKIHEWLHKILFFLVWESIGEYIKTIFFWFFKWGCIGEYIKKLSFFSSCMNRNLWECRKPFFFNFLLFFIIIFFRYEIFKKMYLGIHEISLSFFLRRYAFFLKNVWITKVFYLMPTFF